MPKEKDPIDELFDEEDEDKEGDDNFEEEDEDLKALKDELNEMKKQNQGLLNEVKSQRRKRQDTEERLGTLTDTVNKILETRQTPSGDKTEGGGASTKTTLEYDDDGNPIFDPSLIEKNQTIQSLNEKISNLEQLLQAAVTTQQSESEANKVVQSIVGSDERFGAAYPKYQNARRWVEEKVIEYQKDNNIGGMMTSGQALDYVFDQNLEKEFQESFPGMDLERIVTAEDSQRHLRSTLNFIADAMSSNERNDDTERGSRFQKVLKKPSGLGASANAKGADLSINERLKSLTSEDVLNLSDAQVAQIERALAREEASM